ncbi:MAG TPA: ATPase, T2SS/T4P/T4SS family [Methylophilaceae bacterium]|nr:ATPase, T2SS/T4P/T4SS family [Methylophilaceae bacterium]
MLSTAFEWPTPPYFSFSGGNPEPGPEPCLIYFRDGRKLLGGLEHFLPDNLEIVFQPTRTDTHETISLDQIKSMRLVHPLVMTADPTSLTERADEIFHGSEKQSFLVEFNDNEAMKGETCGYAIGANGLFFFVPGDKGKIIRCFVPHTAVKNYQIGPRIGELLVEEKIASKRDVEKAVTRQRELQIQRLGDYLQENKVISQDQLSKAIAHQERQPILKLGEALIQLDLLTEEQLQEALEKQKENRKVQLGQILIQMGVIDAQALKGALAKKLGIPFVGLGKFNFDLNALKLIEVSLARKHTVIPLCTHDDGLVVAFEDPLNMTAMEELRFVTQRRIIPAMSSREDIREALSKYYSTSRGVVFLDDIGDKAEEYIFHESSAANMEIEALASKLFEEGATPELSLETIKESDNTLVRLVNKMILDAYQDNVSDIHIETYPGRKNTRIRFRKDGTLVPYLEIPHNFRSALISRIKIMAQLDITDHRRPQDGKIDFSHFGPAKLELRVATVPTSNSLEDIVMRILASAKPIPMDELNMPPLVKTSLQELMKRPHGFIVVCGPTGSGKTTTLHSLLGEINDVGRKIWTAEDPIEITQEGLRQVQVNSKIGWTFAGAMRSFLRADPDVIMVGEMRDEETARVGIEASLTGHMVLSTLHTNSAPESIVRLLDMGMDPFNFADALLAILAQRLARSLCSKCKKSYKPTQEELQELAREYVEGTPLDAEEVLKEWQTTYTKKGAFTLQMASGCPQCSNTGYRGRFGVYELLMVTPDIKRMIQFRAPVSELLPAAIQAGMRTLKQDGICKVLQGKTDMAQIRAVCA